MFAGPNVVLIRGFFSSHISLCETPNGLMYVLYLSVQRRQCVTKALNATNLSWLTSHFTVALNNVCYAVTAQFHSVWS